MLKPIILDVECIVCNKTLQKFNHDPQEVSRKMGKITNRRSRTPNWSLEEKQYLLELIKEHKVIVITKSNNGPNHSEEKDVAWNEILRQLALKFGSKFNSFSIKKVKTQWQNMKRIAREEIAINGAALNKYTRQSLEVCNILDIVRDGVLKTEGEHFTEPIEPTEPTLTANIEIKTECVDEDMSQPSYSGNNSYTYPESSQEKTNDTITLGSSSTISEQISEIMDADLPEDVQNNTMKSTFSMTDSSYFENIFNTLPFQKQIQDFFKYTANEKQLKMESLKEERQVVRAMRETAELNKIIAEQKLKHVLWVKKQEMAMYAGEPGSGAGKGGGGGGSIREAGGSFGKMEAAREDEYFYKQQKAQLANLKGHLDKEISFHQEQIKRHEDAIRRHKQQMSEMGEK